MKTLCLSCCMLYLRRSNSIFDCVALIAVNFYITIVLRVNVLSHISCWSSIRFEWGKAWAQKVYSLIQVTWSYHFWAQIWNPDHRDRIWQTGTDMYILFTDMYIHVHTIENMYIPCMYMYILQICNCTDVSVHLRKSLYTGMSSK